jgi:hypothetical protein
LWTRNQPKQAIASCCVGTARNCCQHAGGHRCRLAAKGTPQLCGRMLLPPAMGSFIIFLGCVSNSLDSLQTLKVKTN